MRDSGIEPIRYFYKPVPLREADRELMRQIDEIHLNYPFYGSRNIRNELWSRGYKASRDKIRRLMRWMLKEVTEQILEAEMTDHLGYEKHSPEGNNSGNNRNGKTAKTVRSDFGEIKIERPGDRNGTLNHPS